MEMKNIIELKLLNVNTRFHMNDRIGSLHDFDKRFHEFQAGNGRIYSVIIKQ
jgi:hypothetical protein